MPNFKPGVLARVGISPSEQNLVKVFSFLIHLKPLRVTFRALATILKSRLISLRVVESTCLKCSTDCFLNKKRSGAFFSGFRACHGLYEGSRATCMSATRAHTPVYIHDTHVKWSGARG